MVKYNLYSIYTQAKTNLQFTILKTYGFLKKIFLCAEIANAPSDEIKH